MPKTGASCRSIRAGGGLNAGGESFKRTGAFDGASDFNRSGAAGFGGAGGCTTIGAGMGTGAGAFCLEGSGSGLNVGIGMATGGAGGGGGAGFGAGGVAFERSLSRRFFDPPFLRFDCAFVACCGAVAGTGAGSGAGGGTGGGAGT